MFTPPLMVLDRIHQRPLLRRVEGKRLEAINQGFEEERERGLIAQRGIP